MPPRPRIVAAVGKSGPGTISISSATRHVGPVDQRDRGVDDLAEIMRRNIGRHADGDAAGAIDEQVRKARRQDGRLLLLAVVVRLEIDRAFVDVLEQRQRGLGEPRLGVAHRRRRIVVDRAEIALPVDERQPHREGLRHAHQRVVDRGVAMRVIFTHHVADDARRFHVGLVGRDGRSRASRTGCADARASGRRARRAARGVTITLIA